MWVGYLFTDIEGSTERWERTPDRMRAAIVRHDCLLDAIIAAYGGVIQSRAGDGVFAMFANGNALSCAVELQQKLQAEDWSEVEGLWVRIGVHASQGDGHIAPANLTDLTDRVAANRASRMMACGWGGQTVVSDDAVQAFGVPAGGQIDDLGICRLRGIDEPLRLHGLVHPDLKRIEFPPLHSLSAHSQSIPAQLTPLFGRDDELREVDALLARGRPITIIGPGGNGKTRLAAEIALKAAAVRPVYFVLLAGVASAGELVSQIAATLRFPFHGSTPREDQLVSHLCEKAALLVLDNADASSAYPDVLDRIIARCPKLSVLATSRGALGLAGETLFPLHGLKFPRLADEDMLSSPAFQFYAHEATAVSASFKLDDRTFETFAEICGLLSGSPLALRLAAHWSRLLSLEDVLARLRTGLEFLDSSDADGSGRHGTLRSVFEGSWSLLTPELQTALARLSVLAGDFDGEAAFAVACVDAAVLGALERQGLVSQSGRRRFQVHAIIREYARAKLSEVPLEPAMTMDRHADHYLGMVRSGIAGLTPDDQGRVLDQLQSHIANVRAAWVHIVAVRSREQILSVIEPLFYFLAMRSLFQEASQMFSLQTDDELIRLYCHGLLCNCLVHQGEFEKADALAAEFQSVRSAHPLIEAHVLQALGSLGHVRAQFQQAQDNYNDALAIRMRAKDVMGSVYTIVSLAALHLQRGELTKARDHVKEAFRLSRRTGNTTLMMSVTMFAGDIAMQEERLSDARRNYTESLRLEETVHNPQYRTGALLRLGIVDSRLGDRESADIHFQEALELASDIGDRRLKANSLLELGANSRARGNAQKALRNLVDSVRLALIVGSNPLVLRGLLEIGRVEAHQGNWAGARRIAAVLAVSDLGGMKEEYASFVADLGEGGLLASLSANWRSEVDEVLEDAEIGAWSI